MPLYDWCDKKTGKVFVIYKESFEQYQEQPTDEELPVDERGKEREWVKQLGGNVKVVKGNNWGGGKGNW